MQSQTWSTPQSPLILIYYRFRGQLQAVRDLYCYLQLPFIEIHLDQFDQQTKTLPPHILAHIRKFKIDKDQLPVLLHGEMILQGPYNTVTYTVKKFQRGDALVSYPQTKLQELLQVYSTCQPQSMVELMKIADSAYSCKSEEQLNGCKILSEDDERLEVLERVCPVFRQTAQPSVFARVADCRRLLLLRELPLHDRHFRQTRPHPDGGDGELGPTKQQRLWAETQRLLHEAVLRVQGADKQRCLVRQQPGVPRELLRHQLDHLCQTGIRKVWIGDPKLVA